MPRMQGSGIHIGVDPGKSGAVAVLDDWGGVRLQPCSVTDHDLCQLLRTYQDLPEAFAYIEKVGGYIGKQQPGSAMFNFGRSYGLLEGFLTALCIPYEEVPPQKWLKYYGMKRDKGETDTKWKNRLKAKAQQLFPKVKVTLATADALLIAEFCRRTRGV